MYMVFVFRWQLKSLPIAIFTEKLRDQLYFKTNITSILKSVRDDEWCYCTCMMMVCYKRSCPQQLHELGTPSNTLDWQNSALVSCKYITQPYLSVGNDDKQNLPFSFCIALYLYFCYYLLSYFSLILSHSINWFYWCMNRIKWLDFLKSKWDSLLLI